MHSIFNSLAEISMRILIILSLANKGKNLDTLTIIDFIATYSKDFKINDYNLHGDNHYNFGGFASRRLLIQNALALLLKKHYIKTIDSKNGIEYVILEEQKKVCEKLNSTYSKKYKETVKEVLFKLKNKSSKRIMDELNAHITNSIKEEKAYE